MSERVHVRERSDTCVVMLGVRLRRGQYWDLLVGADGALDLVGVVLFGGKLQREHLLHVQRGCGETEGGGAERSD